MSQFLYFIPDFPRAVITPSELDAIGLGHVHGGRQPMATRDLRFAENAVGLFVSASESVVPPGTAADLRYAPDQQTWRPGVRRDGKPLYHAGYATAAKPAAASLRRPDVTSGIDVPLRDGADWRVPVAHAQFGNATLPTVLDYDDARQQWLGRPGPEFAELCRQAGEAYDWVIAAYEGRGRLVFDDALTVVTAALAVNYRVGPIELAALGLVGEKEMWAVLEAVCDFATLEKLVEAQKKTNAPSA